MILFNFITTTVKSVVLPEKCVKSGTIALTFDDGPTAYTEEILRILDENDVPGTFHFSPQYLIKPKIAAIANDAADRGNEIGLRVAPQRSYDDMDKEEIKEEVEAQRNTIENAADVDLKYIRAPVEDGIPNANLYEVMKELDLVQSSYTICIYHEIDSEDQLESYLNNLFNASNPKYDSFIFLMHDEKEKSFPTLQEVIDKGKEKGYTFVTMSDCLEGYEPGTFVRPSSDGKQASNVKNSSNKLHNPGSRIFSMLFL